ncbi:MAG: FMN-binding glutamate synthase family protein [Akkermansiaceae bacterium]|nr:FMN-binding glutamate synthase family protein [Akkermansiaceae bacterium]MCP5549388.1 FMN-binding glutamate synthase family protein [Akkermansiaceae bacterium]
MLWFWIVAALLAVVLVAVVVYDVTQKKHAILHNFPVIGHLRYLLEAIGPELRQYIVTNNDEERPFSRDQRRWIYASSKQQNNYFGFGTDNDLELTPNYLIVKHSAFPILAESPSGDSPGQHPKHPIPCAKVLGESRGRRRPYRPDSVVYVSGMSFGSLGAAAVEALNRGCEIAGAPQNTGEGGLSPHHLHGADLILQLGTAYFGARDEKGRFSLPRLVEVVEAHPHIRAIEVKLSQGGKPGLGGLLPGEKVTEEIARARGIEPWKTCASPARHAEFRDADGLLDFIEKIAEATGLPVGVKSAVGESAFWADLARLSATTKRSPDFIIVDGGEGGTGAGPLAYTDHVALPFKLAFTRVYGEFVRQGLHEKIVFGGSGKLGFSVDALFAMALGCDLVAVGREAMMAIGCIQAQRCHTGICPAGIATHHPWLMAGLDPAHKSHRLANYLVTLRAEMLKLSHTCGVVHPALVTPDCFEVLDGHFGAESIERTFRLDWDIPRPTPADHDRIAALMTR